MRMLAVTLLLLCLSGAAHAAFRYLDPVPVTATAAPAPGKQPHATRDHPEATSDAPHWDALDGELLQDTLKRWGTRVGIEIHVLTDRRYRLEGSRRFVGTFRDVVAALLDSLSFLPYPPAAEMTPQGVLLIRHRVPPGGTSGTQRPTISSGHPTQPTE